MSRAWEERYAADWEPEEIGEARERRAGTDALLQTNPGAALAIHLELADAGSAFSMLMVGWHFDNGQGVERDPAKAEEYYRRALCAGSWKATIRYACRLYERGAHEDWPDTLGDGVNKGFIPSFFWLAWYRHERSPKARTAREVRHLLETAGEAGHPGARLLLARWAASGKFGLGEIAKGFRDFHEGLRSVREDRSEADAEPLADEIGEPPRKAA